MIKKLISLFALISLTASCNIIKKPQPVQELNPASLNDAIKADYKKFFDGDIEAFSVIFDENDKITATKIIKINGDWEENKGIIRQRFVDNKGNRDSRTWLITLEDNNKFTAIGHDSASPANGIVSGNAIQMRYTLLVPYLGVKEKINFLDTMYMVDENSMIKISEFSKNDKKIGKKIVSLTKVKSDQKQQTNLADNKNLEISN